MSGILSLLWLPEFLSFFFFLNLLLAIIIIVVVVVVVVFWFIHGESPTPEGVIHA